MKRLIPQTPDTLTVPFGLILIAVLTFALEKLQKKARAEVVEIFPRPRP